MGLYNSPDIFQARNYELLTKLEYVRASIDDSNMTSYLTLNEH